MPKEGIHRRNGNTDVVATKPPVFKIVEPSYIGRHKSIGTGIVYLGGIGPKVCTTLGTSNQSFGKKYSLYLPEARVVIFSNLTASVKLSLGYNGRIGTCKGCGRSFCLPASEEFRCEYLVDKPDPEVFFRAALLVYIVLVFKTSFAELLADT